MKRYVIVGNGTAAAGAIEGIRSVDREGVITVISAEKHPAYCRPLISYYLEGKTKLENIGYRGADFYDKNGCVVHYGRSATKLDPATQTLTLDDGTTVPYNSICIATGSSPFVPPMDGLDTVEKKVPFLTLDDALTLESYCTPESRVLIVGAGLIGLKCAEGLCGRVGAITVCDLADRVLSSIFDAEAAAVMESVLSDHGISFLLGDSVAQFDKNTAVMKSGTVVPFDIVVLAVGVRANTALVRDAGGAIYIKDNAGYRAGIHMKEYKDKKPVIVIGGRAGSFLGEYQAGGVIVVLGLHKDARPIVGNFPATGMHGGKMILRGSVDGIVFPPQVNLRTATEADKAEFAPYIRSYGAYFGVDADALLADTYTVVTPDSKNPYRQMYVAN